MNQYIAEVIVCIITGAFTILSLVIQKKQDKVVDKIDKKIMFSEKERSLRQQLTNLSKERESIIHDMMILIMDTNLELLRAIELTSEVTLVGTASSNVYNQARLLKEKFEKTNDQIEAINKEYNLVVEMSREAEKELKKLQQKESD